MSIKVLIRNLLGVRGRKIAKTGVNHIKLLYNVIVDYFRYIRDSSIFNENTFAKKESEITLRYHSVEKGFLHSPIRYRFAKLRIEDLIKYFEDKEVLSNVSNINIQSAIFVLCNYYELHCQNNINIEDYFTESVYLKIKMLRLKKGQSINTVSKEQYLLNVNSTFDTFSKSRASVRDFTGNKIPREIIQKVVKLANNAPSSCNRQPMMVYLLEDKERIKKTLSIQGGLRGYEKNVSQLIVLIGNRNYFYSPGERNQLYVNGGVYLMNLLYSLHYYSIAACTLNWGQSVKSDRKIRELLELNVADQVVCCVAIGEPVDLVVTAKSLKRNYTENLKFVTD